MEKKIIPIVSELLKVQHSEILRDLIKLREQLNRPFSLKCLQKVRELLKVLDQRVLLHLTQEDQLLYPGLLTDRHPEIRKTASLFTKEMGGLGFEFSEYIHRWQSEQELIGHWDAFVADSHKIADQLLWRIDREENELFPLLEALDLN
ncbi:MAG: cation-binding protein [Magnetococcales bacterium]|nr:cation-binding protein [Magnetococcales bacterium]HIJ83279.1 hemerythrin domain-containing protein [Magnetococcales bacterium]